MDNFPILMLFVIFYVIYVIYLWSYLIKVFSSYSVIQLSSQYSLTMRKTEKLTQKISQEGFRKTLPNSYNHEKVSSAPALLAHSLRQLIRNISIQPKHIIEDFVSLKQNRLLSQQNINLNACCSLLELRYIILGLLEAQKQNSPVFNYLKTTLRPPTLHQQYNKPTNLNPKKTSIYIDLDFTQFLNKVQQEMSEKQGMIQKLQDMMIDKDNQIDALQADNQELKRQIEEIGEENIDFQASLKNQKQGIQDKIKDLDDQNKKLKGIVDKLNKQLFNLQSQNQDDPQEFLRRCLLTQAITIQHFLVQKT